MPCIDCCGGASAVLEPAPDNSAQGHAERSVSKLNWSKRIGLPGAASHSEREDWLHDFRNALGNTTIAASAIRSLLEQQQYAQLDALVRQIEAGCERSLRLLGTMPP